MLGFVFEQSSNKEENFVKQIVETWLRFADICIQGPTAIHRERTCTLWGFVPFANTWQWIILKNFSLATPLWTKTNSMMSCANFGVPSGYIMVDMTCILDGGISYISVSRQSFTWMRERAKRKLRCSNGRGDQWFLHTPSSLDRYMFFASMAAEQYKHAHRGYELGNVILDEVASLLADEARSLYLDGFHIDGIGRVRLVWVALEGDLPAQARAYHLKETSAAFPMELCRGVYATTGRSTHRPPSGERYGEQQCISVAVDSSWALELYPWRRPWKFPREGFVSPLPSRYCSYIRRSKCCATWRTWTFSLLDLEDLVSLISVFVFVLIWRCLYSFTDFGLGWPQCSGETCDCFYRIPSVLSSEEGGSHG